jgi:hypothetical protein
MSPNAKTYYKILEVDSEASTEVIEAAYRRLARRYHPDLNSSPDATARMQELNEAYRVLSDPQKRISYDLQLRAQAESKRTQTSTSGNESSRTQDRSTSRRTPEPEPEGREEQSNRYVNPAMPTACQECGRSDASLRFAAFPYVISVLLITFRRGEGGLYCSTCRRKRMTTAKIVTLICGWWGIPWGPIYSLGALFASGEGVIDVKLNADYLRWLGGYFIYTGNMVEAKKAIQASLNLYYDPELAAVAHSIFGDELRPSRTKSKSTQGKSTPSQAEPRLTWVAPVLLVLFVGWVLYVIVVPPAPPPPTPTTTPVPTITVAITQPSDPAINWAQFASKAGLVKLEYPKGWQVQRDTEESIELYGPDAGLTLFLLPSNTEGDIAATIRNSKQDPEFLEHYNGPLRDYLESESKKFDGGLVSLGNPVVEDIGQYSTISNDVVYFEPVAGVKQEKRVWLYFFDCGSYLCQVIYGKADSSAMTKTQQRIAEHMIASIRIDTAPLPPAPNTFSELSFCYEDELSRLSKKCTRHRTVFTGIVERLYATWTPSEKYRGASFLKKWYIDGNFIFESESTNEYAYIEVDTRTSLKPGKYTVDVYVDDTLVARGDFEIR